MVVMLTSALLLVACGTQPSASKPSADVKPAAPVSQRTPQSALCVFSSDAQAKQCKPGELAYFSPDSWGNAQLPLNVIAAYCNTNHPIEFNHAGVVCTFTNKRLAH
jgi:hypothetical protein